MAYNKENYLKIKEEFAHKHRDRVHEADDRRAELEQKYPEFARICAALRTTSAKIYGALFTKDGGASLESIRAENETMQYAQACFLAEHGYPEDYLKPRFDCDICEDRGTVGFRMCECMKKKLILAGYESSGMGYLIRDCSFENFDLSVFPSGEVRENMLRVFEICRHYARDFTTDAAEICGGSVNLILTGATGLGKTHLSAAMAGALIDRGYDVVYDTALGIFSQFESERFGADRYNAEKQSSRYFDCDVLIIDDLGTEMINQFTAMVLFDLINTRLNRGKAMIINTNLSLMELRDRYSDRITSRILGQFRPLRFTGTDHRFRRLAEQ